LKEINNAQGLFDVVEERTTHDEKQKEDTGAAPLLFQAYGHCTLKDM